MKLYLVGGTVRRHMLGLAATGDLDFAVEAASYEDMVSDLHGRELRVWQERPEFVTVRGQMPVDRLLGFGDMVRKDTYWPMIGGKRRYAVDADFTLCRAEAQYSDRRHPDSVTPCRILEDLSRRDFTVNAVAVREDGTWVDPHGGRADAAWHTLRCVGNTRQRMEEDPLRLLRAVRFSVTEGLEPCDALLDAMNNYSLVELLSTLPHERVREELHKAMRHDWWLTMHTLMSRAPAIGAALQDHFPGLWFKPTTEER